eukprot:scaffold11020_cov91-Isochrysis_galbana.AAC.2
MAASGGSSSAPGAMGCRLACHDPFVTASATADRTRPALIPSGGVLKAWVGLVERSRGEVGRPVGCRVEARNGGCHPAHRASHARRHVERVESVGERARAPVRAERDDGVREGHGQGLLAGQDHRSLLSARPQRRGRRRRGERCNGEVSRGLGRGERGRQDEDESTARVDAAHRSGCAGPSGAKRETERSPFCPALASSAVIAIQR